MIKILAKRLVKEECVEDYLAMTKELVAASQAEPGCVTYTLNRCAENPRASLRSGKTRPPLKPTTPASTSPASFRSLPNTLKSITR